MKTTQLVLGILSKEMPILRRKYSLTSIALFGSYARSAQTETSDVDILFEYEKPLGLLLYDLERHLERALELDVDLVSFNSLDSKFYELIRDDIRYVS